MQDLHVKSEFVINNRYILLQKVNRVIKPIFKAEGVSVIMTEFMFTGPIQRHSVCARWTFVAPYIACKEKYWAYV